MRLRGGVIALLLVALIGLVGAGADGVRAQEAPQVGATTIRMDDFPESATFTALVSNGSDVAEVVFFYTVLPDGALTRQPAEIATGDVTRISGDLATRGANFYIPAGADIVWYWQLTTNDGTVSETPAQTWRFEDPRYEWVEIERGGIVVRYYDNEGVAIAMAEEGADAVATMSQLLGIDVDIPLKVYVWRSEADAQGVQRERSEGFDEQIITGGVRVLGDLVHIYDPSRWVIRHELTHILTNIAGEGAFGDLPSWLDEGTATIAEGDWLDRRGGALRRAIERDTVLPVRGMGSNTNIAGRVDVFYGQAAAIVTFLIDSYGPEQFAQLFATFKEGSTVDNALMTVYGFDRDALDNAWRASVGLAPRERGEDRSTVIEDEVIEGPEVAEPEEQSSRPSAASDDGDTQEQQGSAEAGDDAQGEDAQEDGTVDSRSDDEIAARVSEIDRRQSTRRVGPIFTTAGSFPWEYVVVAVAGAILLLSATLFVRIITPRAAPSDD